MGRRPKNETTGNGSGARLGSEEKLWAAADKMRSYMDPAEYKHVVLGLIFLKYISDAFEETSKGRERSRRTARIRCSMDPGALLPEGEGIPSTFCRIEVPSAGLLPTVGLHLSHTLEG